MLGVSYDSDEYTPTTQENGLRASRRDGMIDYALMALDDYANNAGPSLSLDSNTDSDKFIEIVHSFIEAKTNMRVDYMHLRSTVLLSPSVLQHRAITSSSSSSSSHTALQCLFDNDVAETTRVFELVNTALSESVRTHSFLATSCIDESLFVTTLTIQYSRSAHKSIRDTLVVYYPYEFNEQAEDYETFATRPRLQSFDSIVNSDNVVIANLVFTYECDPREPLRTETPLLDANNEGNDENV